MARLARCKSIDPSEVQIVHVVSRCVRQAFLCGKDRQTGRSYEHRREWIRDRMELLASVFAIDCLTFAVMHNHIHLVLRSRPDVAATWSDWTVAERYLKLKPIRRKPGQTQEQAQKVAVLALLADANRLEGIRREFADISHWMKRLCQYIAVRANQEDDVKGHFWEGRFKSQLILDEAALIACTSYVDLNPIRAAMAESIDESRYTGIHQRFEDLREAVESVPELVSEGEGTHRWERSQEPRRSGWLSPIEVCAKVETTGADPCPGGRRASLKGFLEMPLRRYLELLDWTSRQLNPGKRGVVASEQPPILAQLGLNASKWIKLTRSFGQLFCRAIGSPESLAAEAARRKQSRMLGPGASLLVHDFPT